MNRMLVGMSMMGLVYFIGTAGCVSSERVMPTATGDPSPSTTSEPVVEKAVSSGPSDSLKACLDKITSSVSEGAKMVAEQSCRDNEKLHQDVVGTATAKSSHRVSAGTQGDSIEACLARIPSDATIGQRLMAEGSCQRDQMTR